MRIILIEDETLVRLGLCELLNLDPALTVVAQADNGYDAVETLASVGADIALVDVRLPGLSGVEVLVCARRKGVTTPVILITTFDDDETFFRAIQAGANGFIRKDSSLAELSSCIDRVLKGERVYRPTITRSARAGLDAFRPSFDSLDLPEPLTPKELEVLALMTAGMSNKEIAQSLGVAEATIKAHASTIFSKLGVRDRVRAVLKGLEIGCL